MRLAVSQRSWRRLAVGLTAAIALVLVAGAIWLANFYQPLEEGSTSGADSVSPPSLFARSTDDPFGTGTMWVYCYEPNGRFAWQISLRNNGPLPVTILAGDPGQMRGVDISQSNTFRLVDFALVWRTPGQVNDPRQATPMAPVTLNSGDELAVWARFEDGGLVTQSGGTQWTRSLWVRYSVLGIERTAEVALRDGLGVDSGVNATCPLAH